VNIHPFAVVHPSAKLGRDVTIGPFCVVEEGAAIGNNCILETRAVVKKNVVLGDSNHLYEGSVIGGTAQHVRAPVRTGGVLVGSGNTFRECVTVHRALDEGRNTIIGNNNLLMVNTHLAHDCHVGDHAIFANNAMLGGHVVIEDRAFVSAAAAVHQFCRIGRMAMVGGQAHIVKDIPPFVTIDGASSYVVGLNTIGLRRSGLTSDEIQEMKAAYRVIYRSGLKWNEVLDRLAKDFRNGAASHFYEFLRETHRGITQERRMPPGATLKLRQVTEVEPADATEAPVRRAKAG